jgi:hypothetical protein
MTALWWSVGTLLFFSSKCLELSTRKRDDKVRNIIYEVRVLHGSDDEGNIVLRNVSKHFPDYTAL